MCCHAGFWWRGSGRWELTRGSGPRGSGGRGGQLCCAVCFLLCIPLFCIIVVPVPSVCCSVKLPLSRPTGFCLFLSILLRTPAGRGSARGAFVAVRSQTITPAQGCCTCGVICCCRCCCRFAHRLSLVGGLVSPGPHLRQRGCECQTASPDREHHSVHSILWLKCNFVISFILDFLGTAFHWFL